ncbi:MAG: prepilin-type N-terminal cleavage/methylation domain-containing protein [Pseudomonadota bacterium]
MGRQLSPHPTAGFTLIEVVVVVAVLSVLAIGASLATVTRDRPPGDHRVFTQTFERAEALAMGARHKQGLLVNSQGIARFSMQDGVWAPLGQTRNWRGSVRVRSDLRQQGARDPNIVILPNGEVSMFEVRFGRPSSDQTRCAHDGFTGLICD